MSLGSVLSLVKGQIYVLPNAKSNMEGRGGKNKEELEMWSW